MTKRDKMTGNNSSGETSYTELTRHAVYEAGDANSMSVVDLLRVVLHRRRLIVGVTLCVIVLTAVVAFLLPNKYQSKATLLPSGAQDKMADLKRLAGFGSMSAADENSSELFPEILRSRAIQDKVLAARYSFTHDARPQTVTLTDYFDQDNPDKLRGKLNNVTYVSLDKKTGVIGIAVETKYPALSRAVLETYLTELESFNLHTRRSAARDNASYLSRQIDQTRQEMAKAEDELETFQAANRNWLEGSSPDLLKTLARLQREVEIQNKKYLYLTQEYEIAKLDAQKDVPIVRVLDRPSLPVQKSGPSRLLFILAMTCMACVTSVVGVVAWEVVRKRAIDRADPALSLLGQELAELIPDGLRVRPRVEQVTETEKVSG